MATSKAQIHIGGLARRLIQEGLLSEEQAHEAFEEALKQQKPFVSYLVESKLADSLGIAEIASKEFGVPMLDISALDITSLPTDLVEESLIRIHHALPLFKRGSRLFLAVSDPTNLQALDEIKFHTGLTTEAILVEEKKLVRAIENALHANEISMDELLDTDLENLDFVSDSDKEKKDEGELDVDDAPIVKYVNKIILDAIKTSASDIHVEPYERSMRVRYRQDGMLYEVASPPVNTAARLIARIKVMSRMNIAERRIPQDGRIKMKLSKSNSIDLRVNTLPTLHGEKIVMRVLDSSGTKIGIEALGFEEKQREDFQSAIKKPYGMILVTGPTGSGKTVTLYSALHILNNVHINISTAEDPVEIQVQGINQVNMNEKTGLTFAAALRAFLRQDPDIIMVGEIRDLETAEISVKAAQTGHLVLSTLHTNDAPQTLTRLANMGVPPFNIASSVNLILAQRLTRRLCDHCKEPYDIPQEALIEEGLSVQDFKGLTIYKAVGCDKCTNGYKGRIGIFQVMPVSEKMGNIIMENGNSLQLEAQAAKEGIWTLRQSGLKKVRDGITSLEEINRVTKD